MANAGRLSVEAEMPVTDPIPVEFVLRRFFVVEWTF